MTDGMQSLDGRIGVAEAGSYHMDGYPGEKQRGGVLGTARKPTVVRCRKCRGATVIKQAPTVSDPIRFRACLLLSFRDRTGRPS